MMFVGELIYFLWDSVCILETNKTLFLRYYSSWMIYSSWRSCLSYQSCSEYRVHQIYVSDHVIIVDIQMCCKTIRIIIIFLFLILDIYGMIVYNVLIKYHNWLEQHMMKEYSFILVEISAPHTILEYMYMYWKICLINMDYWLPMSRIWSKRVQLDFSEVLWDISDEVMLFSAVNIFKYWIVMFIRILIWDLIINVPEQFSNSNDRINIEKEIENLWKDGHRMT